MKKSNLAERYSAIANPCPADCCRENEAVVPEPEIGRQVTFLREAVRSLGEAVDQLPARFEAVLRPEAPAAKQAPSDRGQCDTAIGLALDGIAKSLHTMRTVVREVIARCEL